MEIELALAAVPRLYRLQPKSGVPDFGQLFHVEEVRNIRLVRGESAHEVGRVVVLGYQGI